MQLFYHQIYEFQKGVRNLILCTESKENKAIIENRLKKKNISYLIHEIPNDKINIYFGNRICIEIIKNFATVNLKELSREQDFILGIMLGYDKVQQCERYLIRKDLHKKSLSA